MTILKWLQPKYDDPRADAKALYQTVMVQARNPVFFGPGRVNDDFDGRMEILGLHLAIIMAALREKGEGGPVLSQSLYDVMVDDFDVALREQGLADTGVKRRIKPMATMILSRVKSYMDAFESDTPHEQIMALSGKFLEVKNTKFHTQLSTYILENWKVFNQTALGDIARSNFNFAEF